MPAPIKLSSPATREFWEIPVVHEDEHLLALDKPARLLTSPDRYDPERPNLMKLLHAGIAGGKPWAAERGLTYLSNAHRLDFETSGIILLAKSKPVLTQLASLFGSEKPHKTYHALVHGAPPEPEFTVDAPLAPHPVRTGLMRVDHQHGKRSRTDFSVRESFRGYTLLECRPLTGRTHQIRMHLKWVKLPIVADELYGGRPLLLSRLKRNYRLKPNRIERPLLSSFALHASRLELVHPVTGQTVVMEAGLPREFRVALKYLRLYAPTGRNPGDEPAVAGEDSPDGGFDNAPGSLADE